MHTLEAPAHPVTQRFAARKFKVMGTTEVLAQGMNVPATNLVPYGFPNGHDAQQAAWGEARARPSAQHPVHRPRFFGAGAPVTAPVFAVGTAVIYAGPDGTPVTAPVFAVGTAVITPA